MKPRRDYVFSSPLAPAIEGLIQEKRSSGYVYNSNADVLKELDTFCIERGFLSDTVTKDLSDAWAVQRETEGISSRNIRVSNLRQVAKYLNSRGIESYVPQMLQSGETKIAHFSVPDEGPLTDYESWMPDFIGGLAKGIEKSRGMIENAMNGITSDMTITPRVMAAQGSYSGGGVNGGDLISGINTALNTALAGGGAAGDIVIPVYIGGDMIDEIVVTAQQRMNLRSGGR